MNIQYISKYFVQKITSKYIYSAFNTSCSRFLRASISGFRAEVNAELKKN